MGRSVFGGGKEEYFLGGGGGGGGGISVQRKINEVTLNTRFFSHLLKMVVSEIAITL